MARLRNSVALAALALLGALPLAAQARPAAAAPTAAPIEVYRREVFAYQRSGRPDPFQPLLSAADLGYRIEDLRLTSIIYSPDPRASVAVFALADSARRFRLRTGQRLGGLVISAIHPRRVDVRVEEFGIARIESITLQRQPVGQVNTGPAAPEGMQPGPNIVVRPQAPAPEGPRALRRGGSRGATPPAQPGTNQTQPAAPSRRSPQYQN